MEVKLASKCGFCFGVTRAADFLQKELDNSENGKKYNVYTFGELIHNTQFVEKMKAKGAKTINSVDEIEDGSVVITRAHGLEKSIIEELNKRDITIIDGICPLVKKVHEKALGLEEQGYQVILIGERKHPEVKASASYIKNPIIIETPEEVETLKLSTKIGVVVQTTQSQKNVDNIISALKGKVGEENIKLYNTICYATKERQDAAAELANKVNMMIVIGGRHSGNTRRLFELCLGIKPSFHIETANELNENDFEGINKVGITAGASTPQDIIDEVVEKLKTF